MPERRPHLAGEDQSVTFVELFFDLVFVYSVTKVVGLLHHGGVTAVGEALLVFWMVWWAWTQFTWALNTADTEHLRVQFMTLTATVVAYFMAIAALLDVLAARRARPPAGQAALDRARHRGGGDGARPAFGGLARDRLRRRRGGGACRAALRLLPTRRGRLASARPGACAAPAA